MSVLFLVCMQCSLLYQCYYAIGCMQLLELVNDSAKYQCASLQLLTSKCYMTCLRHVSTCVTHPPDREKPSWNRESLGPEWRLPGSCQPRMDKIFFPAGCYKFKLICQQETVDLYIYLSFIYALSISLNYLKSTTVILIGGNTVRITCEISMSPVVAKSYQI